jgi:hypothetical protein
LHTPFLALAASQLLWTRLQFGDNILSQIRVGELTGAREQLESTLELLWDLAFARKAIHRNIKYSLFLLHYQIIQFLLQEKHVILQAEVFLLSSLHIRRQQQYRRAAIWLNHKRNCILDSAADSAGGLFGSALLCAQKAQLFEGTARTFGHLFLCTARIPAIDGLINLINNY